MSSPSPARSHWVWHTPSVYFSVHVGGGGGGSEIGPSVFRVKPAFINKSHTEKGQEIKYVLLYLQRPDPVVYNS